MNLAVHTAILALLMFAVPCWAQPEAVFSRLAPNESIVETAGKAAGDQGPAISDAEVDEEIAEGARRMGVTPEQLVRGWVRAGKDVGELKEFIRSYLAEKKRGQLPRRP